MSKLGKEAAMRAFERAMPIHLDPMFLPSRYYYYYHHCSSLGTRRSSHPIYTLSKRTAEAWGV